MTKICIPLGAATNRLMLDLISRAASEPADLYEYRFDYLEEAPDLPRLLAAAASRPILATCRSVKEGGRHRGSSGERQDILRRAARSGAAYLDCEAGDLASLADCGACIRIVSIHDFAATPPDLERRLQDLSATGADWVKFAVTARHHADNLAVFRALGNCQKPAIGIAMGETGLVSRLLGGRFGSQITFASLADGHASAPGQITARELVDVYRLANLDRQTVLHGYLGHPDVTSSRHMVKNRAYALANENAVCLPFYARDPLDVLGLMPAALELETFLVEPVHAAAALAWAEQATPAASAKGGAEVLLRKDGYWLADCLAR